MSQGFWGFKSESRVKKLARTYRTFPEEGTRIPELTFEHHWESALSSNPKKMITRAADEGLSTRQIKELRAEEKACNARGKDIEKEIEQKHRKMAEKVLVDIEEIFSQGGQTSEWLMDKLSAMVNTARPKKNIA